LFPNVEHFVVQDYDPLFSDVHSCLQFSLTLTDSLGSNVDNDQTTSNVDKDVNVLKKPTWDINTKYIFVRHIDNSSIGRMLNEVDRIFVNLIVMSLIL